MIIRINSFLKGHHLMMIIFYDKDMLQTLAGKKMQKRRNHYNAFLKAYPDYEYRDLDIVKDFRYHFYMSK